MPPPIFRRLQRGLMALFAAAGAAAAPAADYPNKPVTIVVPFASGGPTDTSARVVATALAKQLNAPFVVENVPGAGSTIGTAKVAAARPDGYTLLWGTASALAIAPHLQEVRYDPVGSFAPISLVVAAPFILVAKPALGVKNTDELVKLAKREPGKLNYASTGTGGTAHMITELFKDRAKVSALHVPYNGGGPMMTALLGGDVDILFDTPTTITPMVKSQRVVPLAVTSLQRWPDLPEVPTLDEQGYPGFDATTWFGLLAPKGTAPERISLLNEGIAAIVKDPDVVKALRTAGFFVEATTPAGFARKIDEDGKRWAALIKAAGISLKQ